MQNHQEIFLGIPHLPILPPAYLHIQGQPYYDDDYYEQELSGFGYSTKMLL